MIFFKTIRSRSAIKQHLILLYGIEKFFITGSDGYQINRFL